MDSFSGEMIVLWMRNLSLHFVLIGRSSFMACNITGQRDPFSIRNAVRPPDPTYLQPQPSLLAPPSQSSALRSKARRRKYVSLSVCPLSLCLGVLTLGAVVLTLNATGCALLLVIWRARLTDWVNGPVQAERARDGGTCRAASSASVHAAHSGAYRRTVEPQNAAGVERDRHGVFWRDRGRGRRWEERREIGKSGQSAWVSEGV